MQWIPYRESLPPLIHSHSSTHSRLEDGNLTLDEELVVPIDASHASRDAVNFVVAVHLLSSVTSEAEVRLREQEVLNSPRLGSPFPHQLKALEESEICAVEDEEDEDDEEADEEEDDDDDHAPPREPIKAGATFASVTITQHSVDRLAQALKELRPTIQQQLQFFDTASCPPEHAEAIRRILTGRLKIVDGWLSLTQPSA